MASNLTINDIKNEILKKFDLVQVITDDGMIKKHKWPNKEYEKMLTAIEKQYGRILEGLKRLDKAEEVEDMKDIAATLMDIIEVDLPDVQGRWMRSFVNSLYGNSCLVEDSREE